jgi:hypothetical protein
MLLRAGGQTGQVVESGKDRQDRLLRAGGQIGYVVKRWQL